MNILIPIAGPSPYFPPEEFAYPRPMIEIGGKPMIAWVLENLKSISADTKFFFVASQEDAFKFSYKKVFSLLTNGRAETLTLKRKTGGALCTCLSAIDRIPEDEPLIIANSDQLLNANLADYIRRFEERDADGGVITFESVHPRWSYVQANADGKITYAAEKQVISKQAIAGFYYFRKASDFFEAAKAAIVHNAVYNGQFYISSSLNEMVLTGKKLVALDICGEDYFSFYHPKQVESFGRSNADMLKKLGSHQRAVQVVIPAAGNGSRFAKAGYELPKPFIDVAGRPMIRRVMDNLSVRNGQYTLIFRKAHAEASAGVVASLTRDGAKIQTVDKLTEGTACTILYARKNIDNDMPLLIANSDQLVDMDINAMIDDCMARGLDGSILVFRDKEKNPKWSFAKVDEDGLVTEVAEKKPISDLATVGIYFYRRGSDFVRSALDMIVQNERVNNEFYTCPAYQYAIDAGLKIGVYEITQDQMHGIGTPEDLNAYLKLHHPEVKA